MAVLIGSYSTTLLGVSIFVAFLTYLTYKLLSDYLHKWFEMKPIPELGTTYPFIGNALQFKNNAGGKQAITCSFKVLKVMKHIEFLVIFVPNIFIFLFKTSFVKFRILPGSSEISRCLNSGSGRSLLWFCITLRRLR